MKKTLLGLILLLTSLMAPLHTGNVVIVMGPSCVGKSTTIKTLLNKLGTTWHIVDFDALEIAGKAVSKIESDEDIFKKVMATTNNLLCQNKNVIIDTNVYYAQHTHFAAKTKTWHLLLYAPLQVLLVRDQARTQKLKRSTHQAYYARNYVIETFERFFDNTTQTDQTPLARIPCDCCLCPGSSSFESELLTFIDTILLKTPTTT